MEEIFFSERICWSKSFYHRGYIFTSFLTEDILEQNDFYKDDLQDQKFLREDLLDQKFIQI